MMRAVVDSVQESKKVGFLRISLVLSEQRHGRTCTQKAKKEIRESYEVSREDYISIGEPREGEEILDEEISVITRISDEKEAFDRALRIVAFGDNSYRVLYAKLMQRGFSRSVCDTVIEKLKSLGYIDEDRQLRRLVEYTAKEKLIGIKKLVPLLVSKGYSSSDVIRMVGECEKNGNIDFGEIKKSLFDKYSPGDEKEKRLLLYKHGF
ncbi:MAG: hypothetical protein SOZ62_02680 [Eubacteriales bacterium]|nr:hypothetical protein [Eubacteriales bacterium]